MNAKYAEWIAANIANNGFGECASATEKMQAAFPELNRVRGHYYCLIWGERAHWWLTTDDGEVVDPTAAQFPTRGSGEYVPWIDGTPEPTGPCANCGGECFNGDTCCSKQCGDSYVAWINGGCR